MQICMEKRSKIIIIVILLVGLALSVYLVLNYQTILSRAAGNDYDKFNVSQVKDGQESAISCTSEGVCDTQSLDVKLQIKDLEQLSQ